MKDLSLEEISERIIDVVISENMLDRDSLRKRIKPILNIWVKHNASPKTQEAYQNLLDSYVESDKKSRESLKKKYQKKVKMANDKRSFYRNELIKLLGTEGIEFIDAQLKMVIHD